MFEFREDKEIQGNCGKLQTHKCLFGINGISTMMDKNEKEHLKDAKVLSKLFSKSETHKRYKKESSEFFKEIIPKEQHKKMKDLIINPDYHIYSNGFEFRTGNYINKEEFDLIIQMTEKYTNYWISRGNSGMGFTFLVRKDLDY